MPDQVTDNYDWFQDRLPELMAEHHGQHALLRSREIVDFFSSSLEAIKTGLAHYGEGNFSVEAVDDRIEDLGFYSHVSAALHA